jgi:hypothetical protein
MVRDPAVPAVPWDTQLKVDWLPGAIFAGVAFNVTARGAFTVAVAVAVAVPLVAVIV